MLLDMLIVGIPIAAYAFVLWLARYGDPSASRQRRWP
jgi:hypothetical protein